MGGWSEYKVAAKLVIDGMEFECVRANVAYQLNTIPYAMFMVAVGRGKRRLTPAAIHKTKFTIQAPVELYVSLTPMASGGDGEPDTFPAGGFRLFQGYLTGVSWNKSRQHEHAILHARHWLLDMDYSSALSDMSHPLNPSQFSFRAAHDIPGAGGASWTVFTEKGLVTAETLKSDFWKDGLHPWLQSLTEEDLINNLDMTWLGEVHNNSTAARALARFTTDKGNYVPLAMNMHGADPVSLADAIWNDVQAETYDSLVNTTLWGKLVGDFASRYMFAVVPRVEDAIVVPFVPGLQKIWNPQNRLATIMAKDYALVGANVQLMRMLRAVGVFSGLNSRTGADNAEPTGDPITLGIGGLYHSTSFEDGMLMLKQGPRWLSNIIAADRYSAGSAGAGVDVIGNAMFPGAGNDNGPLKPKDLKRQSKDMMDSFAKALYVYEQLRLRQLELSGKFRLDIAPGSTVSIEVAGDRFIEKDVLTKMLVGDVTRVTYLIDSETPRIATDFNLAHIRTVDENKLEDFSMETPPFWTEGWAGAGILTEADT